MQHAQPADEFVRNFGRVAALYMEACVHCGMCAEACHFHVATGDPQYTPIWKIEPMKRAYRREYGPFAPLLRLFGLVHPVTSDELERWRHLVYDSCTLCGRCSLVCPMGIDIAGLIGEARCGMAAAGLAPEELTQDGASIDGDKAMLRIAALSRESGVDMPVDREKADILCTLAPLDLDMYPTSIVAMARVLNSAHADWTFARDGYLASAAGTMSGDRARQRRIDALLIEAAIRHGARTLLLPECGHAYGALRWEAAELRGAELPFEVLHFSEFLARALEKKQLRVKRVEASAAFHDPCQVSRRGGAFDAPMIVLRALGIQPRQMFPGREANWCCGGGGGVMQLSASEPLRRRAIELKMTQIEDVDPGIVLTSCTTCRHALTEGASAIHWDRRFDSLVELVAANLAEDAA